MLIHSVVCQSQTYEVVLVLEDDGGYSASAPGVPGAYSDGDTEAEVLANIADAIAILRESEAEAANILEEYWRASQPDAAVRLD